MEKIEPETFAALLEEGWDRGGGKAVRLIGAGVRFVPLKANPGLAGQLEMF